MTSPSLPLTTCQSNQGGRRCGRVPRFQAQLEAEAQPWQVRRSADACADHLGDVVQALTDWARDHDLTTGQVTVLAVDPAAGARQAACPGTPSLTGFAFSTIPLGPG
jgi:hypothetical protein